MITLEIENFPILDPIVSKTLTNTSAFRVSISAVHYLDQQKWSDSFQRLGEW